MVKYQESMRVVTNQYHTQLKQIASEIHRNLIIPLCDKLNYTFIPDMGADKTWAFYNERGVVVDHSMLPSDVTFTLNVQLMYFEGSKNRLGQNVKSYQPAGFAPTY